MEEDVEIEEPVLSQLEISRLELLDLGMRNKLLNHRTLKSKGIDVQDERPHELYRILVTEGRRMSFVPIPEEEETAADQLELAAALGQPDEEDLSEDEALPDRHTDNKLQTSHSSADLQKRLLNTYYEARTYIEEQGVNTLFLALGMLKWYEAPSSDQVRLAPLVLVPIELDRTSVRAKFRIAYNGDEIGENLSLRAKLESDFGLVMPDFPDAEDLDLQAYFDAVSHRIQDRDRWEIDREAIALAFFSYIKLLMFEDLDPDKWPEDEKPQDHSVLRGLLTDGFDQEPLDLAGERLIDEIVSPAEANQVLDADSSQTLAIHEALNGKNLIIQGPPGTGKSQTIANLIAEGLAHNKTILFVSEKMAALDVVKRRLDAVGLGEACLELHSQKTKKKEFLAELQRCIQLGQPKEPDGVDATLLRREQERLNGYAKAVNSEIGESQLTPFEVYGRLIEVRERLSGMDIPDFSIEKIHAWSRVKYASARATVEELEKFIADVGVPDQHPFYGTGLDVLLPDTEAKIAELGHQALNALDTFRDAASELAAELGQESPTSVSSARRMITQAQYLLSAPDLEGVQIQAADWKENHHEIADVLDTAQSIQHLRGDRADLVADGSWGGDVSELRETLEHYRRKWWRFISGTYRQARARFSELILKETPRHPSEMIAVLVDIQEERALQARLQQHQTVAEQLFGSKWSGWKSDIEQLRSIVAFMLDLETKTEGGELPQSAIESLSKDPAREGLRAVTPISLGQLDEYRDALHDLLGALKMESVLGPGLDGGLIYRSFDDQAKVIRNWVGDPGRLQEMISLKGLVTQLDEEGMASLRDIALTWEHAGSHLVDLLDNLRLSRLLEFSMHNRPELAQFDGNRHESAIAKFRELDTRLLTANRIRLAMRHWQSLPKHQAGGQLGNLRREFAKKRRHKPVRRLMKEAGNVIQAIKPVFMMSPLSIPMFLPPGTLDFDLVIFDEASQVKPVDAFGAILRGKQVVIAGDDKQLPPTTFFEAELEYEDEDEVESQTMDLESVLGLAYSQGMPQRMLEWHYRSEHESLIAVSNQEFYDERLVIFPSPDRGKEALGLAYHYLPEATYARGKSSVNRREARAVAEAVMAHARKNPNLTLGVAAFSVSQAKAIRDELEILRREDPSLEDFFNAFPHERFFVKNLENVQGDERDVIFISIGYGWTPDGRIFMNFGPLNRDGGERRREHGSDARFSPT